MANFLEQLAEALIAEHGSALSDVAVVLPSQRASLYLRRALARAVGKTQWSPEIFTLSTFMERVSGLRALPIEELLFEAYEAHRTIAGSEARPLDDFLEWIPTTLRDISEVDAHLVPLDAFYRDLRSWEELDWSFNTTPLSDGQQRMVRYWAMVGKLHAELNARLLERSIGTSGLVERTAAERIATFQSHHKAIWFAGLNAFNKAQSSVIDHLRSIGIARFAWDADQYYLGDHGQEAGTHLREAIARYGAGAIPPSSSLNSVNMRMRVTRAPNAVAQAWCAADRARELSEEQRSNTAIVLADETLLAPLLEALPGDHGGINITMGLHIASLPVGSLFTSLHALIAGAHEGSGFFHADVDRVLRHPFLRFGTAARVIDAALVRIADEGHARISAQWIIHALGAMDGSMRDVITTVFANINNGPIDMREHTNALITWAQQNVKEDAFATEQLYQASIALHRIHRLMVRYDHRSDPATYAAIMRRLLRSARVGLFGEPLSGLQVMGALEARALDFERVIVLGAQEGKMPSDAADRSYIPFELRREYKLPLRESTDGVQAYNFLRMVQRASDVELVHADEDGSSGPSRYIAQLSHELFHHSDRFNISDAHVPVPIRTRAMIQVPNEIGTRTAVRALLQRGLSPSAFGTWLRCPLDFWFRYVLRMREPDAPGARIGANILGNALHKTVESIYRPWLGKPLSAAALRDGIALVDEHLRDRLLKDHSAQDLLSGQPLLQFGMASHAARNFLLNEAHLVEGGALITPLALEEELSAPLGSAVAVIGSPVTIKGRLDRVDSRNGVTHIMDLKTGRVETGSLVIKELTLDALRGNKRHAAQLLLYAWLYLTTQPEVPLMKAGLLPLQRPSESEGIYLNLEGEEHITRAQLPAIETIIIEAVRTMLDPDVTFRHDDKSKYCVFCA